LPEEDLLAQSTRRRIYEFVDAHPGTHMRELQRRLAMSAGTLEYHLRVLVREDVLAQRRHGRYTRFYVAAKVGRREKDVLNLLRQEVPRRICALLLIEPEQSHGQLLHHFRLAPSTLTFHLRKLLDAELVVARRDGRETRYHVTDPGLVGRCLVAYQSSFLDEVVDRFADVWLNLGAGLEAPGDGFPADETGDPGASQVPVPVAGSTAATPGDADPEPALEARRTPLDAVPMGGW